MADDRPRLTLIAALARGRAIGRANQLPWHLPEDLAHFRRTAQGAPVLMGRKTWDSLPARFRPLPGRRNLVLSRQAALHCPGAEVVSSVAQALALAATLVLTELDLAVPDADAFFPAWDAQAFAEVARDPHRAAAPNDFGFAFVTYQRTPARN